MARRTKEEALATRERLLDAAELLFQSQGVSQTTLQQIAQAADATRGAVYWHFKDKADLFNAMMDRVTLPLEAANRAGIAEAGEQPLVGVERSMLFVLRLVATDPQVRRVFDIATRKIEYTDDMTPVRQRHLASRQAFLSELESALRDSARRRAAQAADSGGHRGAGAACAICRPDRGLAARSFGFRPGGGGKAASACLSWRPRLRPQDGAGRCAGIQQREPEFAEPDTGLKPS